MKKEIETFKELGAKKSEGQWTLPDGRETVNKQIMREILSVLHQGGHWGVQAMCDAVLRKYVSVGMFTIAKQVCNSFITHQRVNKKAVWKQPLGGWEPGL